MSNKTVFQCNVCGAQGKVTLDDDHEAECCPSCGAALDLDDPLDEEDE